MKNPESITATPAVELSIIIVNWNSARYVRQCVQSIEFNPPALPLEIVVVDSGSFDDCGEMLHREFPQVRFIQSQENVGFAAANNLGVHHSRGRLLLFLNPDTEIVGDAISKLIAVLENSSSAGLIGARLLNSDGSLQTSCVQSFPTILNQVLDAEWLRRLSPRSRLWGISALHDPVARVSPVEVVSGACMLMRRSIFQNLGGFNEKFFMYSEDLDLCYRIRRSGLTCIYAADAEIVHHGGGSSSSARSMFSVVMMRESIYRLLQMHRGKLVALSYRAALGLSSLVRLPALSLKLAGQKLGGKSLNTGSLKKWMAILRWSIGGQSWVKRRSSKGTVIQNQAEVVTTTKSDSNSARAVFKT